MLQNTNYRIAVITNTTNKPSIQDLVRVATENNVAFDLVPFPFLEVGGFGDSDFVQKLLDYDVVYYRTGLRGTFLHHLVSKLTQAGIPVINGDVAGRNLERKIQQAFYCDKFNIKHPRSIIAFKTNYADLASQLGPVFVVKPDIGSKGKNVSLIHNQLEFEAAHESQMLSSRLIYQELITDAEEYRVYTVGGQSVASYKKIPGENDFRANLHTGGSMMQTEPETQALIHAFAANAAQKLAVDILGIDILVKNNDCYLLEINQQPGWENLSALTGIDLCKKTLQFILDVAHTHKNRS